jgi:hypothetical protein
MDAIECGDLLALMAQYDYRTVDEEGVMAWLMQLGGIDFTDAFLVVAGWHGSTRERMTAFDVRDRVRALRQERIERAGLGVLCPPPSVLEDDGEYRAWLREARRVAAGPSEREVAAARAWQAIVHRRGPAAVDGGGNGHRAVTAGGWV